MAKNHEISEYFFDKYDLSLIYVPHRHNSEIQNTLISKEGRYWAGKL